MQQTEATFNSGRDLLSDSGFQNADSFWIVAWSRQKSVTKERDLQHCGSNNECSVKGIGIQIGSGNV